LSKGAQGFDKLSPNGGFKFTDAGSILEERIAK